MIRIQRVARTTRCSSCRIHKIRTLVTQAATAQEGVLIETSTTKDAVAYPEILDVSPKAEHRRQQEEYFNKIKKLGTIEEKLIALNMPKYYGWPSFVLKEGVIPYNFLPFSQFITRTVIREDALLPCFLAEDNINQLKQRLKKELEKVILFEKIGVRHKYEVERLYMKEEELPFYDSEKVNEIKTRRLVKQMNSVFVRVLARDYPHLFSAQTDLDPRLEAFWRVGGFYSTEQDRKLRRVKELDESMIEDPIDRFFQYFGSPILQLRGKDPLEVVPKILPSEFQAESEVQSQNIIGNSQITDGAKNEVPQDTNNQRTLSVAAGDQMTSDMITSKSRKLYPLQEYRYSPDLYLEIPRERYHGAVIPGFWPNDPYRFGIVSYHSTDYCVNRPVHYGSEDHIEALHSQAILASYAWAYGQACYQGFTTYNDITYPFVTQTVLTNGKLFSFYQYQLNTIVLHTDKNEPDNPLHNECYATLPTELYHEVDGDKVKGWNDEAILNLLNIYTKPRRNSAEMNLCPYLDENKLISHVPEEKRRKWLYETHRYLASHRPRHRLAPEIYDWERIYKIENQKRVTDARKRFFEKFEDPINDRKLNEHKPKYIPKACRPGMKKSEGRNEEQFYPDVLPTYHEIV